MTSLNRFRLGWLKPALYLIIFATIITLIVLGAALYAQVIVLTTPFRQPVDHAPDFAPYQDVAFTAEDGLRLAGWYLPGRRPAGVVLVHGIHANRAYLLPQARFLAEAGYHLLILDLRGHGESDGALITYGYTEAEDVKAGVSYLLAQPGVEHVAALGHSLGAAAVIRAAAEDDRIEALIVQSSFSSLSQAVADSFETYSLFPRWPFAPLIIDLAEYRTGVDLGQVSSRRDLAEMTPRPVLIIHSEADNIFPVDHAWAMYEAARGAKDIWIIDDLPHINPIEQHEVEYKQRVLNFLDGLLAR